jgi:hypothetical protein
MAKHLAEQFELPFRKAVVKDILDTANDIDEYLCSSAPIECYRKDIDRKLSGLIKRVKDWQPANPRKSGEHVFAPCGGVPRCVTCGCDEDDAFIGGQRCTFKK